MLLAVICTGIHCRYLAVPIMYILASVCFFFTVVAVLFSFTLAQVTELFTAHMAKTAHQYTVLSKRKTIQRKDVDSCVVHHDEMSFLEGMLDS